MPTKKLYIISGCNGAGKTTASVTILPEIFECKEFVNADEIAKGLSPFNPESVAIQAGKLMLERINYLLTQNDSFAIETTLSTKSYQNLVLQAHEKGFYVQLLYFWLPSPEFATARVAQRVKEGGHNIPKDVIYRRYFAGLKNLFEIYMSIVDYCMIIDNAENPRAIIAEKDEDGLVIYNKSTFNNIRHYEQSR
ncbi:MAG: zeta toxin family protein [Bacteroidales bacterium]|nr:zeta toxin family protein [Bacteroidales bacterium]